jgi:RNA polymerase sigma-70 factor (ECF subfamily)
LDIVHEVKKAKQGDKTSFEKLIYHFEKDMYIVAKTILNDDNDCADAVSESILKAYESISQLKQPRSFKTWLMKILVNNCYQIKRLQKRVITIDNFPDIPIHQDEYSNAELYQFVNRLEADLKLVVVMYYFQDLSVKEISNILDIPVGTVKSRLSRARKRMWEMLNFEGGNLLYGSKVR